MRDVKCRFLPILKERLNAELFCSLGMVLAVVVVAFVVVAGGPTAAVVVAAVVAAVVTAGVAQTVVHFVVQVLDCSEFDIAKTTMPHITC